MTPPQNLFGFHIWQGNDTIPVSPDNRAKVWYKRYAPWDSLTTLKSDIGKAKAAGLAFALRIRAIPWDAPSSLPTDAQPLYVTSTYAGKPIYIPRYSDPAFRSWYEAKVKAFADVISASGVALAFADVDGMGHGGESHTSGIPLTDAQQPTPEARAWSLDVTCRIFGADKAILPTDRADVVQLGIQRNVLGWRRDSLGHPHFHDGLAKDGIDGLLQEWTQDGALAIGENYGNGKTDVALATRDADRYHLTTVANGNFNSSWSSMGKTEQQAWLALADSLRKRGEAANAPPPPVVKAPTVSVSGTLYVTVDETVIPIEIEQ